MMRTGDRALVVRVDTGTAELIPDPDLPDAWLLRLNGTAQSHVNLNDPTLIAFDYIRRLADVIDTVAPAGALDLLHLGGGALTLPRCLSVLRPGSHQRVVEIDRALAELVQTRLPVPDELTELVIADARTALAEAEPASTDVVVADIFAGSRVPVHVTTVEFARAARRVLRPGGWYLANVMDSAPLLFARRQAATLREAFGQVAVVADAALLRGRGTGNLVLVAGEDPAGIRRLTRRIAADPTRARVEHGAKLAEFVRNAQARWDE
ncbi:spermidine synthase [Catellatospora tritici]|uniref:spermidine synthase n=1 Tax=Catellatospora tritici TaxID=2851566 RepID=UPI001C2D893B|nr:fused MFS/spermidine synthase [Catellatospora tritici]MBV1852403.1 fused MFS/spermidine synthase [Catellatospora tritici]